MRQSVFALLLALMLVLTGCVMKQSTDLSNASDFSKTVYSSDTSTKNCYLCGDGIRNLIPSYWDQNNIALISLNTFEIKPLEINRYNGIDGRLVEEYAGTVSLVVGNNNGGFSTNLMLNSDRGYATGSVSLNGDEMLDLNKVASFLCEDCLNGILPAQVDECFGLGAINLSTGKVRIFDEHLGGFTLGDFYVKCDLQEKNGDTRRMDILIFFCPIRYEK